jgi:hypothetical protein
MKYALSGLLLVAICLGGLAFHYHGQSVDVGKALSQAMDERDSAEKITGNVITTMNLFNDIAKANEDAKQKNANDSEPVRVVYKTILAKSACSRDAVDRDVADGLLNRAGKIRSGTSGAYPR